MSKEPRKRQRSSLACEECRVKKAKCSGHLGQYPCLRCQKRKIKCRFDEKVPRRGPDPKKRKTLQQDGGDNISPSNLDDGPFINYNENNLYPESPFPSPSYLSQSPVQLLSPLSPQLLSPPMSPQFLSPLSPQLLSPPSPQWQQWLLLLSPLSSQWLSTMSLLPSSLSPPPPQPPQCMHDFLSPELPPLTPENVFQLI